MAHKFDSIHIDTGASAADVDGRTNVVRGCQSFRQRINQVSFSRRDAFFDQGAEAAQEVDAGVGGAVV